jgi:putative transposase
MRWKGLHGGGRVSTARWSRRPWPLRRQDLIRRIGGKKGSKRHILVDERGAPLSLVVTGANRHDVSQLEAVLGNRIISPPERTEQNLCADKGYTGEPAKQIIESHGYIPHVKERGEEINCMKNVPGYQPRRWIVELTHSWFNRFRKLLVRYEKRAVSYEALIHLACAIICWRKINKGFIIYG